MVPGSLDLVSPIIFSTEGVLVILLNDLSTGRYENIPHLPGRPDAEFVLGSNLNADLVDELMARARGATVFTSTPTGILSDGSIRGRLETAA